MKKQLTIKLYENNALIKKHTLTGTFNQSILSYELTGASFLIDLNQKSFKKENKESILNLTENKALLTLKELNQDFLIPLKKYNLILTNNIILLEYHLESQDNPLKIKIEMSDLNGQNY